ncbi:ATPase RavA domain-containing protein, partial [Vibrio sp. 2094]
QSFVDPELPRLMESSLQRVSQRLESIQGESEKIIQRFKNLHQFFS